MTSVGLAAGRFAGEGALLVVGVSEAGEGSDRNSDGDTLDEVAHLLDLESGSERNLGVALSEAFPFPLEVGRELAALVVSEEAQGLDLNQDGDVLDHVLEVHGRSLIAGAIGPRLALAPLRPLIDGTRVAFAVSEADEGNVDLNGDGDALDAVPRVFRLGGNSAGPALAVTELLGLREHQLAFTTDEAQHGGDLNGDGDAEDAAVLQFYSSGNTSAANAGLDTSHVAPFARLSAIPEIQYDWFVLVSEQAGGIDLDGDGDADDLVAHATSNSGWRVNLRLPCFPRGPLVHGWEAAFLVHEAPGGDRNGDGDAEDVMPVIVDVNTEQIVGVDLAIEPTAGGVGWCADLFAFDVDEAAQDADLDGDGDRLGLVAHVTEPSTRRTRNLGLDSQGLTTTSEHVLVPRSELDARADWNHDGDQQDTVFFVWEARSGSTRNTAVAGALVATSRTWLLLAVAEQADGRDWNGDGDVGDLVYVRNHLASGRNTTLGLAGAFPGAGRILDSDRIVVLVDEASSERDLNQDGDELDSVPVVWE